MDKLFTIFALLCLLTLSCNKPSTPPIPVTGIALSDTSLFITEGDEVTLVPIITPEEATNKSVIWMSEDEEIATVNSKGVVTAQKKGQTIVTVTTVDGGMEATCTIDVAKGFSATTGEANHISCRSAKITGKADFPDTTSTDLSFGVLYSTSEEVSIDTAIQIIATEYDSDYNFTINTEVLKPETEYYYRSYINHGEKTTYGKLKSFKTLAISSMIMTNDASDINLNDAVLNASLNLSNCMYDDLEYGFEVTPDEDSVYTLKASNHSQNKFSVKDETLAKDTRYSFVAYVTLDGQTYRGKAKTFATVRASITAESSNIKCKAATISGKLDIISEGSFTKSAVLYYSRTANSLEALKAGCNKQTITLNSDGNYSVVANKLKSNSKYYYCVIANVENKEFASTVNDFTTPSFPSGAVDLGLSVIWHQCNIGATKPEEYGTYFAWGDVNGQTWDGSAWSGGGFFTYPTYQVDSNNNLKPEYDAAHVLLGGNWRMPTRAEWKELVDNCYCTWTSNYKGTGIAGRIFTSKMDDYTYESIFLPAAGYGSGDILGDAGSNGLYWSRTFYGSNYAWYLHFTSASVYTYNFNYFRDNGQPVRPVLDY